MPNVVGPDHVRPASGVRYTAALPLESVVSTANDPGRVGSAAVEAPSSPLVVGIGVGLRTYECAPSVLTTRSRHEHALEAPVGGGLVKATVPNAAPSGDGEAVPTAMASVHVLPPSVDAVKYSVSPSGPEASMRPWVPST